MLDRHDLYRVGTGGMTVFEPENVPNFLTTVSRVFTVFVGL